MTKQFKALLSLALLAAMTAPLQAEEKTGALAPVDNPGYIGIGGGTSFGQGTFCSITENGVRSWGLQGGIFGGYKFNRLASLELGFQYGQQSQYNLQCCPYWLSTSGEWRATQVIDQDGWYYDDLQTFSRWFKLALQANFDLLSFIPDNRHWSLDVSPQISVLNTQTTWKGNLSYTGVYTESVRPANWHLGLGGQVAVACAFNENWKLALYGGVTALTGKRFDCIPTKAHKTNLIWDAGLKLTISFGGNKKKKQAEAEMAAAQEAARLAAEREAQEREQARLAAEKAAKEKAEREAAELAAKEKAEREAAEEAARLAAEEAAKYYHGTFPTVYFGDSSYKLGPETEKLKEVARIMAEYPNTTLSLDGFASPYGTPEYNQTLTDKRLKKVKDYLVELGVEESRIVNVTNHGMDRTVKKSRDGRRVEIAPIEK